MVQNLKNKKVSIIIIAYNRKEYVLKAIDSVVRNDYPNIEIIYVDGGSTDGTIEEIQAKYVNDVRIVITTKKGVTKTRNVGGNVAKGDIFLFLDSDAELNNGTINKAVGEFEDQKIGAIGMKIISIDDKRTVQGRARRFKYPLFFPIPISNDYETKEKIHAFDVLETAFFVRASVYRKLRGFDEDLYDYGAEGLDFCWRVWNNGYIVMYLSNLITYHKSFAANPSASKDWQIRKNLIMATANFSLIYLKNGDLLVLLELPIIMTLSFALIINSDYGSIRTFISVIGLIFKKMDIFLSKRKSTKNKILSDFKILKYLK